jgi:hypothetical protein
MEHNQTYKGIITRYNQVKKFGFVSTKDDQSFFFFIDTNERHNMNTQEMAYKKGHYCIGDEVEFKLKPSLKEVDKLEAYDLIFFKNEKIDLLLNEANQADHLLGYLKLINEEWAVKHVSTYVIIPLEISTWEENIYKTYHSRLEQLVPFRLIKRKKIDYLKAELTDTVYIKEYYDLQLAKENGTVLKAKITGKNSDGIFATVLNNQVHGFIRLLKNADQTQILKFEKITKGDYVNALVKSILGDKRVTLSLLEDEEC